MLTWAQLQEAREKYRRWLGTVAPCGISHVDIYNPCLAEDVDHDGRLMCVNCGLRQRLELTAG
jgi:hypothetical protein